MRAFLLELKSICLSYRFLFFILIILFLQITFIQQSQSEMQTQQSYRHIYHKNETIMLETWIDFYQEAWGSDKLELTKADYENLIEYHRFLLQVADKRYQHYIHHNWEAYNLQTIKFNLLLWENDYNQFGSAPTPSQYFGEEWQDIRSLGVYPHFAPHTMSQENRQKAESTILNTDYHWHLHHQSLQPLGDYYPQSPWAFVFNFVRNVLPSVLGAIALTFTVNLLHQERKTAAQKTALQFQGRPRYLSRKVAQGFLAVTLVVLLPLVMSVSFLGIRYGFSGLNHPVLLNNSFLSFSVNLDQVNMYELTDNIRTLGLSQYAESYTGFYNLEQLDFIPLWKFLGLSLLLTLLFILFCSVLGILISLVIKNGVFAQMVAAAVAVLGASLGNIFPNLGTTPWDIFSAANSIPLLEGGHHSTYLSSFLSLGAGVVLLFLISTIVFQRQDVNC